MLRRGVVAEGGLGGVGSYLAEAASAIFKPTKSDVPWEGTASPFSGRITHHEEVARLKKVYELVQEARQVVQGAPHSPIFCPRTARGSARLSGCNAGQQAQLPPCVQTGGRFAVL